MNEIQDKQLNSENLSLAKNRTGGNNSDLSKNYQAVTPNCPNWLFLRPNTAKRGDSAGVNPSYTHFVNTKHAPSYDGVTPQNKPVGEYVGRLLDRPRVNPITPYGDSLKLKNYQGAFKMLNSFLTKLAILSPIQSALLGFALVFAFTVALMAVLAIFAVMGV